MSWTLVYSTHWCIASASSCWWVKILQTWVDFSLIVPKKSLSSWFPAFFHVLSLFTSIVFLLSLPQISVSSRIVFMRPLKSEVSLSLFQIAHLFYHFWRLQNNCLLQVWNHHWIHLLLASIISPLPFSCQVFVETI